MRRQHVPLLSNLNDGSLQKSTGCMGQHTHMLFCCLLVSRLAHQVVVAHKRRGSVATVVLTGTPLTQKLLSLQKEHGVGHWAQVALCISTGAAPQSSTVAGLCWLSAENAGVQDSVSASRPLHWRLVENMMGTPKSWARDRGCRIFIPRWRPSGSSSSWGGSGRRLIRPLMTRRGLDMSMEGALQEKLTGYRMSCRHCKMVQMRS